MPLSRVAKGEVFLSHSSKDLDFVVRLARVLKRHKIRYWYSATHIAGAKQWHDEIGRALARCDWFLVVLTPDSVRSPWVKRELLFALNEFRYNERIIPVLRRPCEYSRFRGRCLNFKSLTSRELRPWLSPTSTRLGNGTQDRGKWLPPQKEGESKESLGRVMRFGLTRGPGDTPEEMIQETCKAGALLRSRCGLITISTS